MSLKKRTKAISFFIAKVAISILALTVTSVIIN